MNNTYLLNKPEKLTQQANGRVGPQNPSPPRARVLLDTAHLSPL